MKNDMQFTQQMEPARRHRRWFKPLAGLLLLALALALAAGAWLALHPKGGAAAGKPDAVAAAKKAAVYELGAADVVTLEARELRLALPISGTLGALNQATVKAKVAAEVRESPVPEGIAVARGQVVMRLDTADLLARVATQQAAQDEARARLALAQKNHDTNSALLQQKFISQNAFDTAQNSVELAQAAVKSAASQWDIARRALDDAVVRAPIDGIISKRYVQPGEKAAPDMPLFAIVNLAQLLLEAQVPAGEIARVKVGQDVAFKVDGFQDRVFNGKVARINPMAEAGSRAMTVYIAVDNSDAALRGGMFAKGDITLEKSAVAPLLPLAALRQESGVSVVYKIEHDKVVAQAVELGLRNEDEGLAVVKGGLAPGAQVLVVKLDGVKPGSAVKLPPRAPDKPLPAPDAAPAAGRKG